MSSVLCLSLEQRLWLKNIVVEVHLQVLIGSVGQSALHREENPITWRFYLAIQMVSIEISIKCLKGAYVYR